MRYKFGMAAKKREFFCLGFRIFLVYLFCDQKEV